MATNFNGEGLSLAPHRYTASTRQVLASVLYLTLPLLLPIALRATPKSATQDSGTTPSVIAFSPSAILLNNPTGEAPKSASTLSAVTQASVNLTIYNSAGNVVLPSTAHPLHVHVYGAPNGVISPIDSVITSGTTDTYTTVNFNYNGAAFPNSMELAAWMDDPAGGASLGTTLFVHQNRPACSYGAKTFPLDVTGELPSAIQVQATVGADNPQTFHTYTIDTGSLGVIVTKSDLILGDNVHGPGAPGQKFYDSSGYVFTGNYYLAPVSVELKDGSYVQSNPILVLAVDAVTCHPNYPKCHAPKHADLHYLGVGFDRNTTGPGDLFDSPSENAFLELTDAANGTDINEGYELSTSGVNLGITPNNAYGFKTYTLAPNSAGVIGDWNPVPGCYQFTTLPGSPQFCGNLLLDVGISEMFIDLPSGERPAGSYDNNGKVPSGLGMRIQAGNQNQPVMSYDFTAVQPPAQPSGPAPTYAEWVNDANIFVNTGRRPLMAFDYFYSGQCGVVGFKSK